MALRSVIAALLIGAAAWMQGELGDRNADRRRSDFRYTPDPRVVKVVAGAYRSTSADLLWLRTLPDMSRTFSDSAAKARWIHNALDAITDLEPGFGTVYDVGPPYLLQVGRSAPAAVDRAIALLEKGQRAMPHSAGIITRLAMIWYTEKKDRKKCIEYLRLAAPLPDMDGLSMQMLATLEANGREDLIALGRWLSLVETGNRDMRDNAWEKFYAIKQAIADRACREYRTRHGAPPTSPEDLRDPSLIQEGAATKMVLEGLELRPGGVPYYKDAEEFTTRGYIRLWRNQAQEWYAQYGRWPTTEELRNADMRLPPAPDRQRWELVKDELRLVDE